MASPDVLVISEKAQERLLEYMRKAVSMNDDGWQLRSRFEAVDRQYMLENDQTEEQQKARRANAYGDPTKLQNMQVPMVMEATENTVGFFTNVFLLEYPMFKFASNAESENLALMWNTLVGEDQVHYGWAAEMNVFFRNCEKYNFGPLHVNWQEDRKYKVMNGAGQNGTRIEEEIWKGNKITSLDPYNTIYDSRVQIHRSHIDGEFAGWIEPMTRIQLKRFIASLGDKRLKNDVKAFESPSWQINYYVPRINPSVWIKNANWSDGSFNWDAWVTDQAQGHIKYHNSYVVTTLYARIMPYEFGIRAPSDQTPDIWKLIAVNGVLVFAEPVPNAHDYLPVIIGQTVVDNLDHQTKSPAENQMTFQSMVSALWNAKLASARRRTTDRMLYNPLLVDPDHINSPNPSAKIPIRPTAYGRKLDEAVYVFPFNDDNGQLWMQEANGVAEWGMRANGQNRPSVGQFQKGNKLQDEWKQTMANAGSRERSKAVMIENHVMQPVKEIIKSNYMQFTPKGKKYNRSMDQEVEIDPVQLRNTISDFQVGDGLLPIERLVGADVMTGAFQIIQQDPRIGAGYNLAPLYSYMMKLQGVIGLEKFEKTPEQIQYEQQMAAWTNIATLIANNAKYAEMTPEQIQQAIGPMPQPPKTVAQTKQEEQNANNQPS